MLADRTSSDDRPGLLGLTVEISNPTTSLASHELQGRRMSGPKKDPTSLRSGSIAAQARRNRSQSMYVFVLTVLHCTVLYGRSTRVGSGPLSVCGQCMRLLRRCLSDLPWVPHLFAHPIQSCFRPTAWAMDVMDGRRELGCRELGHAHRRRHRPRRGGRRHQ
ncbi:hypothetical protein B0T24DRAFT_641221 [Lasiosphaeria ovina]|uniref:Uncharacterized protein n=1 Tax=Lasiosphaeria ovina TaxID=92902 RepID=A0AAE0JUH6_9PEZI|nr:hypothetical protein B0T24DRAFT_641221 [Lasiosphaeria ovina]